MDRKLVLDIVQFERYFGLWACDANPYSILLSMYRLDRDLYRSVNANDIIEYLQLMDA